MMESKDYNLSDFSDSDFDAITNLELEFDGGDRRKRNLDGSSAPAIADSVIEVLISMHDKRKKVVRLRNGKHELSKMFLKSIKNDPAFREYANQSFVVFQIFNQKFSTWVDYDESEPLLDGTHLKAHFITKDKSRQMKRKYRHRSKKLRHRPLELHSDSCSDSDYVTSTMVSAEYKRSKRLKSVKCMNVQTRVQSVIDNVEMYRSPSLDHNMTLSHGIEPCFVENTHVDSRNRLKSMESTCEPRNLLTSMESTCEPRTPGQYPCDYNSVHCEEATHRSVVLKSNDTGPCCCNSSFVCNVVPVPIPSMEDRESPYTFVDSTHKCSGHLYDIQPATQGVEVTYKSMGNKYRSSGQYLCNEIHAVRGVVKAHKLLKSTLKTSSQDSCGINLVTEGEVLCQTLGLKGKNPVQALHELCNRLSLGSPEFEEHMAKIVPNPSYIMKVTVKGKTFVPETPSSKKKMAKNAAANLCLKSYGVFV